MRAVVLSDDQTITFLNENFINTWVPNSELGRITSLRDPIAKRREREGTQFDTSHALAQAIMRGWKKGSPADCLIISPTFELMGKQPINELLFQRDSPQRYVTFLQESLAGKQPGLREDTAESLATDWETFVASGAVTVDNLSVALTTERPKHEVLSILRTPETDSQNYTVIEIDAIVFKAGGVLTIDLWVGDAEVSGSFDLFAGDSELSAEGTFGDALASARDIRPNETGVIRYPFDPGQVFKLGAIGTSGEKGNINGFLATISVEPVSEKKAEH